ncbi:MAG: hypothetical protein AAGA80_22045 [Cyanobacteria bacterium P01_F01_bin.143]
MNWIRKIFGDDKSGLSAQDRKNLEVIEQMLSGSSNHVERELADDEEERIFYDEKTGETLVKIVKKTPGAIAIGQQFQELLEEEENRYPKWPRKEIKGLFSVKIELLDSTISIRKLHEADSPEDSDVLGVSFGTEEYKVHPYALFEHLIKNKCHFWSDIDRSLRDKLSIQPWHQSDFCDDSREFFEIEVGERKIRMISKYLGARFYITGIDNRLILLARELVDSDSIEIPDIICDLEPEILKKDSARYDNEAELWEYFAP